MPYNWLGGWYGTPDDWHNEQLANATKTGELQVAQAQPVANARYATMMQALQGLLGQFPGLSGMLQGSGSSRPFGSLPPRI